MNLIELHILQSFPVTCLNRDDVGAPKTAYFGGTQRARVSSQSWKRAIRKKAREIATERGQAYFSGTRTRFVVRELKRKYEELGKSSMEADELAKATGEAIGKLDPKNPDSVKTLLYFSPQEIGQVVDTVLKSEKLEGVLKACLELAQDSANGKEDKKSKKYDKAFKELVSVAKPPVKGLKAPVRDAADIALFGRMVADDHTLMVEGAGLFSHALSTHRSSNEVEFFSAVDDNSEPGDEGAGHIGTLEFNSACYYRYIGLNLDLLEDDSHLGHLEQEEREQVIDAFLRACVLAVPGARRNSMFGHTLPAFILGLRRKGQPLSLINAFEEPIRTSSRGGYIDQSVEKVEKHYEELKKAYGLKDDVRVIMPDASLDEMVATLIKSRA